MKHFLICAFTVCTVLSGCDSKKPGDDGYTFDHPEFVRTTPVIRIVVHPNQTDLQAAAKLAGQTEAGDIMAWSAMSATDASRPCVIHIVDPAKAYAPQWIGHELTHCIYGRWHK